ncbi:MAG: 4Fe-4S binding protein [Aigarchaeota archaeon]|nr:4Fe-4S binding protein [Aigarchaeota archaeon]
MLGPIDLLADKVSTPSEYREVFRTLMKAEDLSILLVTAEKPLDPKTVARRLGRPEPEVRGKLEALWREGLVYKSDGKYGTSSFTDTVHSRLRYSSLQGLSPQEVEKLRDHDLTSRFERYDEYLKDKKIPTSSQVIPIEQAIEAKQWVIPTQKAVEILREAESFAFTDCGCRLAFRRCSKPIDTCLLIGKYADLNVEKGLARRISLEEAEQVLKKANEHGLVHLTIYTPGQGVFALCSCCECCCHDLQIMKKFGRPDFIAKSEYIAETNLDQCSHCGDCVDRCIFEARTMANGSLQYDPRKCFGCGLCVTTCPTGAIGLVERKSIGR